MRPNCFHLISPKQLQNWDGLPILSLDECLSLTVDWYKFVFENPTENMYEFSVNQIQRFCQIASVKNKNWMHFEE